MDSKQKIREYLHFSKRDRIGVGVLLFLIGSVFFLPELFPLSPPELPRITDSSLVILQKKAESRMDPDEKDYTRGSAGYLNKNKGEKSVLFHFDPNKLSPESWQQLGLKPGTIRIIQNYLSKGGKFRKPEDLQKIYGMTPLLYEQLLPWVKITPEQKDNREVFPQKALQNTGHSNRVIVQLDINTTDTTGFIALPGIGSKLAGRIVNFREKLGGFYSVSQVSEVFGLTDSVFQKIRPLLKLEDASVKKIRLNTVTIDELKKHPYFRYELARAIIAFRNAHGAYRSPEELKQVMLVTENVYLKILPYVSCE